MEIKRITVKIDGDLHKALRQISIADDTTLQDMFVEAIKDKYLARIHHNN